jgi:hypothetical protein
MGPLLLRKFYFLKTTLIDLGQRTLIFIRIKYDQNSAKTFINSDY